MGPAQSYKAKIDRLRRSEDGAGSPDGGLDYTPSQNQSLGLQVDPGVGSAQECLPEQCRAGRSIGRHYDAVDVAHRTVAHAEARQNDLEPQPAAADSAYGDKLAPDTSTPALRASCQGSDTIWAPESTTISIVLPFKSASTDQRPPRS